MPPPRSTTCMAMLCGERGCIPLEIAWEEGERSSMVQGCVFEQGDPSLWFEGFEGPWPMPIYIYKGKEGSNVTQRIISKYVCALMTLFSFVRG